MISQDNNLGYTEYPRLQRVRHRSVMSVNTLTLSEIQAHCARNCYLTAWVSDSIYFGLPSP